MTDRVEASPATGAGEYAALADELAGPRRALEKAFLDMGDRLMDCARLLREITSAHEGMPAELQSEEFASAVASMHTLREEAGRISGTNETDGAQVETLSALSASLYEPIDELNKAVRNLRLIAVNARIVAAGIRSHTGDFDAFALEMVDLGRNATSIVAEFTESHARLVGTLGSALAANESFRQRHGGTLAAIADRLATQLATTETHKLRAVSDAAESGRLAKQISSRIGDAVSALQIGDITRQRLEHIEDGLRDVDREGAHAATATAVCQLQLLQLDDTGGDYSREVASFAATLRSLSSDARHVLDDSRAQSEALLAKGGTALAGLARDLKAMMLVLGDFEAMRAELAKLRAEVAESVSTMRERMEAIGDLEQSMRLLSINTAVRCSRLGEEGRALRVIAQEMRELAAHTVEAAATVTDRLEEARSLLGSPDEADRAADAPTSLAQDAAAAVDQLDLVVARLGQRASTIGASGPRATGLLQQAADAAQSHETHADAWQSVRDRLEHLAGDAENTAAPSPDFFTRLRARYTMVSERHVHDAFCSSFDVAGADDEAAEDEILEAAYS